MLFRSALPGTHRSRARKLLGDMTARTHPGNKLHGARNRRCNTPCDTCWIRRLSAYDIQVGYLSRELRSGRLAAVLEEGHWDSCASMESPRFLRLRRISEWWNEMHLVCITFLLYTKTVQICTVLVLKALAAWNYDIRLLAMWIAKSTIG